MVADVLSDDAMEVEDLWASRSSQRAYARFRMEILEGVTESPTTVLFNLLPAMDLEVSLTCHEGKLRHQRVWEGTVVGASDSHVILVQTRSEPIHGSDSGGSDSYDPGIAGKIVVDGKTYRIRNVKDLPSIHAIEEVDLSSLPLGINDTE